MNGRRFDAQVVLTDKSTARGKLMSQYVCARITSMKGINIGLFEFDRHNAIYFFVLNADEHIYLRYGGRDAASASSYLDLASFELALETGLELHAAGTAAPPRAPKPAAEYPRDIALLNENVVARGRCVECHLIDDFRNQELEQHGHLDKLRSMYRSPDIKRLGLLLDVSRGLVVRKAKDAAAAAGIEAGDKITRLGETAVHTFGDLQFYYDRTPRDARSIELTVERDGSDRTMTLELPQQWWRTDISYRYWSVDPLVYFESRPLTVDEKHQHGLPIAGFASVVTKVDLAAALRGAHTLAVGDITRAVDGVDTDDVADSTDLFIKLRHRAGAKVTLDVLRDGEPLEIALQTGRQSFRK